MKLWINWSKIKFYFFWKIGWYGEKLLLPGKFKKIWKKQNSLIGCAYFFLQLSDWKIKSPLQGKIDKIYPDYCTIKITNRKEFQLILNIKVNKDIPMPLHKILKCVVKENQIIDSKTILYKIFLEKKIISVNVFIPWQPEVLEKVRNIENDKNYFCKVYYRSSYNKMRLKKHGEY